MLNNSQTGLNESRGLNIFPGIKFFPADGEIVVRVGIRDLLQGIYSALFALGSCFQGRLSAFLYFRNGSAESKKREEEKSFKKIRLHDDDDAVCYAGTFTVHLLFRSTLSYWKNNSI